MRFLHLADLHLTNNFPYGSVRPSTGLNKRFEEQLKVLKEIFTYAVKRKIKYVLIAGDIFHNSNPTSRVRTSFASVLKKFPDLKIIAISGNHDTCGTWHSLQDYAEFGLENFTFIYKLCRIQLDEEINVVCVPWGTPVNKARTYKNKKAKFNVLLTHQSVLGASFDNEYFSPDGPSVEVIEQLGFDYVALGHFHKMQRLTDRVWYSGSIYPRDFREIEQPKYFLDVTLYKNGNIEVVPVMCRDIMFRYVYSTDDIEVEDIQGKYIKWIGRKDEFTPEVEELLKNAEYYFVNFVQDSDKARKEYELDTDLFTVGRAIEMYVNETVEEKYRNEVLKKALDLYEQMKTTERV